MSILLFHHFPEDLVVQDLPERFTFPFHYVPHPLCRVAANEVMAEVERHAEWLPELRAGKMLGVLVVEADGNTGFLAAFSGNLCGSNNHDFFVPAVYDMLAPDGMFKQAEREISEINALIDDYEHIPPYLEALEELELKREESEKAIEYYKRVMRKSKAARDAERKRGNLSAEREQELISESQFQKAELRRLRSRFRKEIAQLELPIAIFRDHQITPLKQERKALSEAVQRNVFKQFAVLNARGEQRTVWQIFNDEGAVPPSGAGECCAPKLLQCAYVHGLRPLAMAEFWYGESPKGEVRHHGHFYPACTAKCRPILSFMLQGLDVMPDDRRHNDAANEEIKILYNDPYLLVVDKPAGLLTTAGRVCEVNLEERLRAQFPEFPFIKAAHRLDQSTSGIVLLAMTPEALSALQRAFENGEVHKAYEAVVDGCVAEDEGVISLPLIADITDRPRQKVDRKCGKKAVTRYTVVSRTEKHTRLRFEPVTGRTHQLRVHASHPQGLNAPIVGDMLYGEADRRLLLHACHIRFKHPVDRTEITIDSPPPF